jgi:hypothetical protein
MKYRKKPVIVEAKQWDGSKKSATELLHWIFPDIEEDSEANELTIDTLEGKMRVSPGDFVIKGIKGEFYPCKPDIFNATYECIGGYKE